MGLIHDFALIEHRIDEKKLATISSPIIEMLQNIDIQNEQIKIIRACKINDYLMQFMLASCSWLENVHTIDMGIDYHGFSTFSLAQAKRLEKILCGWVQIFSTAPDLVNLKPFGEFPADLKKTLIMEQLEELIALIQDFQHENQMLVHIGV